MVIDIDGIALAAHCTCMVGVWEVCSHVIAVFFVIEARGREATKIGNPVSECVCQAGEKALYVVKILNENS